MEAMADALMAAHRAGLDGTKLLAAVAAGGRVRKSKGEKPVEVEALAGLASALDGSKAGLDGLLFGRMATGDVTAVAMRAVAVSHALTVHPLQDCIDYFTAVDELAEGKGAGHLDTAHLTADVH